MFCYILNAILFQYVSNIKNRFIFVRFILTPDIRKYEWRDFRTYLVDQGIIVYIASAICPIVGDESIQWYVKVI